MTDTLFPPSRKREIPLGFKIAATEVKRILDRIFDPILNFIINIFGKVVNLISLPDKDKRNLMSSNSNSVV